jgi:DNA-binding NarL/FixJ family response regulator
MQAQPPAPIRVVIAAPTPVRQTLHDALTAAGLQVVAACGSAAELLDAVARERPDVCVLDRALRGGGLAAAAAIAEPRRPRVLVLGGRGSPSERRAARLAGADDCLPSDIDAAVLTAVVAMLARKEHP